MENKWFPTLKLALNTYTKKGAFGAIKNLKSNFGSSSSSSSNDVYIINYDDSDDDWYKSQDISMLSDIITIMIMIASIILGFMAVTHICKDSSERGKNTRLGLYLILILSSGSIGWLYILLWIFNFNICK